MIDGISIIIPNWNGKRLLETYLPSLFDSIKVADILHEIIIVDDASTDGSVEYLKTHYPNVHVIQNDINKGFSVSCNKGISRAKYPWVLILNNDVKLTSDYVDRVISNTEIKNLFSVSGQIKSIDTHEIIDGGKLCEFTAGNFRVTKNFTVTENEITSQVYYSLYNPATCCLYNREKLLALNGFDETFSPFNWEDTDVAYRAWKRGWITIYEPRAWVLHHPGTTINSAFRKKKIYTISRRNKFFFHWKNLSDPWLIVQNVIMTVVNLLVRWLILDFRFYSAFWKAFKNLPVILKKRKEESNVRINRDSDVMKYLEQTYKRPEVRFF